MEVFPTKVTDFNFCQEKLRLRRDRISGPFKLQLSQWVNLIQLTKLLSAICLSSLLCLCVDARKTAIHQMTMKFYETYSSLYIPTRSHGKKPKIKTISKNGGVPHLVGILYLDWETVPQSGEKIPFLPMGNAYNFWLSFWELKLFSFNLLFNLKICWTVFQWETQEKIVVPTFTCIYFPVLAPKTGFVVTILYRDLIKVFRMSEQDIDMNMMGS